MKGVRQLQLFQREKFVQDQHARTLKLLMQYRNQVQGVREGFRGQLSCFVPSEFTSGLGGLWNHRTGFVQERVIGKARDGTHGSTKDGGGEPSQKFSKRVPLQMTVDGRQTLGWWAQRRFEQQAFPAAGRPQQSEIMTEAAP